MFVKIKGKPHQNWNYRFLLVKSKLVEAAQYYYKEGLGYRNEYTKDEIEEGAKYILKTLYAKELINISRDVNMKAAALVYAMEQTTVALLKPEWITWYEKPIHANAPRNEYNGLYFDNYDEYFKFRWGDWTDYTGELENKSQKEKAGYLESLVISSNQTSKELAVWKKSKEMAEQLGIDYHKPEPEITDEQIRMAYYIHSHPTVFSNNVTHSWHCVDEKEEEE